ncbi:MAG: hypothetical protein FJ224_08125 [Lentisphaerae bacterium]|nr:hypothetical protein [Lentisphaerota bacterium]
MPKKPFGWVVVGSLTGVLAVGLWGLFSKSGFSASQGRAVSQGVVLDAAVGATAVPGEDSPASGPTDEQGAPPLAPPLSDSPLTPTAGVPSRLPAPSRPNTHVASPLAAGNEGVMDPGGVKDRYTANEILDERTSPPDANGQYERVRVVKTRMKYPLVRVVDRLQVSGVRGQVSGVLSPESGVPSPATRHSPLDTLLSQTAMVANHVTLKVTEGTTEAQLAAYAQAHGGTILRKLRVPGPGTYLVAFDQATVDTVPNAVAALSHPSAPVEYVNPDYVVYATQTFPNDPRFSELYGMHNTSQIAATGTVVSATNTVSGSAIAFSPVTNGVTGTLYHCGIGNPGDFPAGVSNNIALIQRGTLTFAEKAANAKAKGATAVIIYNNVYGDLLGTFQVAGAWLPSLAISDTDGALLLTRTNTAVTVSVYGCKFDADIDAPEAWDISTGSTNIVVGVIDTGIDYNHPDLAANMWVNTLELNGTPGVDDDGNGFIDDVHGYDFVNDDGDPMDDHFHGTHCAGTIGGVGNNGIGVAGVCWTVRMMGLKFLSSEGGGNSSDAMEAVYYATANGAKLTSNSWGGGGYDNALRDAIIDAGNHGLLFVAAAGNSAGNNDVFPTYPGSYDCSNIIAVAATDYNDALAGFSCYGATTVDIGAPGVNILSCFPTHMTQAMTDGGYSTNYASISGTSMATPAVAGACALLALVHPELTLAQWRAQLLLQADPVPALEGKCFTGARLNVFQALTVSATPVLRLWSKSVRDPAPGGNGDGLINPGETGKVSVVLLNGGMNTATGVTATLTSTHPMVAVVSNTVTFEDIAGFSQGPSLNDFVFSVATDCPPQVVSFQMVATDTAGGAWTNTLLVRVRSMSRISGAVTFNGAPAEGYRVNYDGRAKSVLTDSEGHYSIDVLDGTYLVYVVHPTIENLFSDMVQVTVPPAATNVDFAMLAATISGRVTDARTGNPLTGATVDYYISGPAGEPPYWYSWVLRGSTTVDANGEYSLITAMGATSTVFVTAWTAGYSNPAPREVILPPGTQNVDFAMSAPDVNIGVTPSAIHAAGVLGQTVTQTLVIANSGGGSLPWTLWNESNEGTATAGQRIRTIKVASECVLPYSAAFDGSALCLVQDWSPKGLFRLNPANGALLNAWTDQEIRNITPNAWWGLDWDGMNFWFSDTISKKVVAVDPTRRQPVKSVDVMQNDAKRQTDIVLGGGYLWALTSDAKVHKLDPRTGATLASLQLPLSEASALEYFSGAFWVLAGGKIYKVSPTDGRLIRSFNSPHQYASDLAKDRAGNLWVSKGELDNSYAYLVRIGTAPWLAQSATSGTAPAGGSNTVRVTLNTTTAGVGIHTAMVSVASIDPDEPEKLVPVTFTVTATLPPVIDTPAAATPNPVTLPATAALSVTAHDPDGDPLSYTWSKVSGPGTVTFTPNGTAGSANSAAGFGAAGTYVLRVTVVSTNRTFEQATSDVTVYAVGIETDVAALSVPEGSNNTFQVRLVTQPAGSVTVAVARVSGDADITVANGAELVFDTGNWSAWQTVTLAAGTDEDIENGSAAIALSAAGLLTANVTATEQEAGTILHVNAGPGGTASPAGRNLVLIGVPVTVTATPDATHNFARWVTTEGSASFANPLAATTTVTVVGPATIRANFNPPPSLSAWAWGANTDGRLGDGSTISRSTMVRVIYNSKPLTNITAISGGFFHSVALRGDGRVLTWGKNTYGQLGDGTVNNRVNPVLVTNLTNVSAISAGGHHTLALTTDSNVWVWGRGDYGQLGNGTNSTIPTPVPVKAQISNVTAIAGGALSATVLKSDGSVWEWGHDNFSLYGSVNLPVQVADLSNVVAIASASMHSMALKADGTVWHWGTYLGTPPDPAYTPAQVPISNVIAIAAGSYHEVALKADGTVWTWGYNDSGQIGDGTINDWPAKRTTPTQVLISNVIAIASAYDHTLALKGDGSVWAWGDNQYGQCGDGTTLNQKPTPVQVPGTRDFLGISVGLSHSLALREDQPYIRITNNVAALSVPEGGTNTFQARLSAKPWTNVTVTVIRASGDGDVSVQSTNTLTFTPGNWNSWQTVTVAAAEDNDAANGTAVIWLSGADFGSTVTVTEAENDTTLTVYAGPNGTVSPNGATVVTKGAATAISAIPNDGYAFTRWTVLSGSPVIGDVNASNTTVVITAPATVQADFSSALTLTMTAGPGGTVSPTGAVTVASGVATSISASPDNGYLFANWTVTSGAAVFANSNAANTLVTITTPTTIQGTFITAPIPIVTDVSFVGVPEGGTKTFRVRLAAQPEDDVTVAVARTGGDTDITVQSGSSLTFTPGNWSTWQTVTLAAAEDGDAAKGSATLTCSGPQLTDVIVTATEIDNDIPPATDTDGDGLPDDLEVRLGRATNVAEQASALPFLERFESDTVTLGELSGQNKWVAVPTNTALVQSNEVFEGLRALQISNTGTTASAVSQAFTGAPLTVVWLDLRQKVAGASVPDSVPDAAVGILFNSDGRLVVCDGARPAGAEWVVLTNHTPRTAGTWARLTVRADYAAQTWNLYLDSTNVAENLGFASPQSRPTCLSFEGSDAVLDDLYVGLPQPAGFPGASNIVPDEWYLGYFGEIRADGADSDGDRMSNLDEYLAGTRPNDDTSYLGFMGVSVAVVPGEFVVRWQSVSNKFYTLQATTNLLDGFTLILGTNIPATPPENVHTDNVESVEQRFYRVKAEQE